MREAWGRVARGAAGDGAGDCGCDGEEVAARHLDFCGEVCVAATGADGMSDSDRRVRRGRGGARTRRGGGTVGRAARASEGAAAAAAGRGGSASSRGSDLSPHAQPFTPGRGAASPAASTTAGVGTGAGAEAGASSRGRSARKRNNKRGGGRGGKRHGSPERGADAGASSTSSALAAPPAADDTMSKAASPAAMAASRATELTEKLTKQLVSGTYECMICFEEISRRAPTWACGACYAIFDFKCLKKWRASIREQAVAQNLPSDCWRCPGCQTTFTEAPVPSCFCGKEKRVEFNPYVTPHSCGGQCGRIRHHTTCPHPCTLLCHPGPCPPCTAMGECYTCHCGRTNFRARCGELIEPISCANECGRLLSCGNHRCKQQCHAGACDTCAHTEQQQCYCGHETAQRPCGSGSFDERRGHVGMYSCGKQCDSQLGCGNHRCERTCHPGKCSPCRTDFSACTSCPCGRAALTAEQKARRTSCLDPVPTCGAVCDKLLPACGMHRCWRQCHEGACAPCDEQITVKCRCGYSTTQVACCEALPGDGAPPFEATCDRPCGATKRCGKHRCKNKCCPDARLPDGLRLSKQEKKELLASTHPCTLQCNKQLKCGLHKCPESCHSGKCPPCRNVSFDELACPCGRTVLYPPIQCNTPPPQCPHECSIPRPCGHPVAHECHPTTTDCSRCVVLVANRFCMGGHQQRPFTPCYLENFSCGRPCGKMLPCGLHSCDRECHLPPCLEQEGVGCGKKCAAPRSECEHTCQAECHPLTPCPRAFCTQMSPVCCPCGRRKKLVMCGRGAPPGEPAPVPADTPTTLNSDVTVQCDEQCRALIRKTRLAEAFGKKDSEGSFPTYSPFLTSMAPTCPSFVRRVESTLDKFLSSDEPAYFFPPMNNIRRRIVHELAVFYGIDTESVDEEPRRSVILRKTPASKLPTRLLSEFISMAPSVVPQRARANEGDKPTAMLISNLSADIKSKHLNEYLSGFGGEYCLQWIDDEHCAVIFADHKTMLAAVAVLNQTYGGVRLPLKAAPLDDEKMESDFGESFKLRNPPEWLGRAVPKPAAKWEKKARDLIWEQAAHAEEQQHSVAGEAAEDAAVPSAQAPSDVTNGAAASTAQSAQRSAPVATVENWAELLDSDDDEGEAE